MIIAGTLGICLLYSVAWILSIFGVNLYFWNNPTPLGIAMSIGICLLAAFNLFLDFAVIEKGIERKLRPNSSGIAHSASSLDLGLALR